MQKINHILIYIFIATIALLITALIMSIDSCKDNKLRAEIAEHNILALNDTIRIHKDMNGDLFYEKMTLLSTQKGLEKLCAEMAADIKSLQWKNDILAGANITANVKDTINDKPQIIYLTLDKDTTYILNFADGCITTELLVHLRNEILSFNQFTYELSIPIEAYFTADYRIILRSKNQKVTFSDVQSFIDPSVLLKNKKKHWNLGIQTGLGIMPGYDIFDKKAAIVVGPYFGLGLTYKFLEW
jgi:hypothetical protein